MNDYVPDVKRLTGNVYIVTRNGMIYSKSGASGVMNYKMFKPQITSPLIGALSLMRRGWANKQPNADDAVLGLIHSPWSAGYYHWVTESLPRAIALKDAFPKAVPILPSSKYAGYVESLEACGFSDVEFFPDGKNLLSYDVIATSAPRRFATTSPLMLHQVKDTVRKHFNVFDTATTDVVYVSRKKSRGRIVSNEDEIVESLGAYAPRVVSFEDLSFREQVECMGRTKLLISIHGAALTNMLFLPKGAAVLELLPRRNGIWDFNTGRASFKHDACYIRLAEVLGHRYAYLENRSSATAFGSTHMADISVSPTSLREKVAELLNH